MTFSIVQSSSVNDRTVEADAWGFPNRATPLGTSAYYSLRFAPAALRRDLAALFAWRHEVRRILDEVTDPGVARIKLDWWREEIQRTLDGAPRHPLSHEVAKTIARHELPIGPFLSIADRVQAELQRDISQNLDAQATALTSDRGALFVLIDCCHLSEHQTPSPDSETPSERTASRVGAWCQQVRLLRDAGRLMPKGREVLTRDRLQVAGQSQTGMARPDQRTTAHRLLLETAEELADREPDQAAVHNLPRALRIQSRIHAALLRELITAKGQTLEQRIALTPLHKLWIAWRTPGS